MCYVAMKFFVSFRWVVSSSFAAAVFNLISILALTFSWPQTILFGWITYPVFIFISLILAWNFYVLTACLVREKCLMYLKYERNINVAVHCTTFDQPMWASGLCKREYIIENIPDSFLGFKPHLNEEFNLKLWSIMLPTPGPHASLGATGKAYYR